MNNDIGPESLLLLLLIIPKLIHFGVYFAIDGFKNGITLTHFGMKKGALAKGYAVFYAFAVIFFLVSIPVLLGDLFAFSQQQIQADLFTPSVSPLVAFLMNALAFFLLVFVEVSIRFSFAKQVPKSKKYLIPSVRKMNYSMALFPLTYGIPSLFSLPGWVRVAVVTLYCYVAPFASPAEFKRIMIARDEIRESKQNPQPEE